MKTRRWALTALLILSIVVMSPGFGLVFADSGSVSPARVEVSIAAGETAEVVVIMKPVSLSRVSAAGTAGALKAGAATSLAAVTSAVTSGGGKVLNQYWINNSVLARVDTATLSVLAGLPNVERIIPNFKVYALDGVARGADVLPPLPGPTWGLRMIGAPQAWSDFSVSGNGVKVAVLDTGIDPAHPDLAGKLFTTSPADSYIPGGWMAWKPDGTIGNPDGTSPFPTPVDYGWHGTHVSGTIAGGATSGVNIGVAPGAKLMMGAVLPNVSSGSSWGYFSQILSGMQWAMAPYDRFNNPSGPAADVVSMSLGAPGYVTAYAEPIRALKAAGIVPVVAIGNSGPGTSGSPGNIFESWGIGAVGPDTNVASYSGGGTIVKSGFGAGAPADWPESWLKPDLSAPGGSGTDPYSDNIYSSVPGGYGYAAGTSMATPHVSGAVALLLEYQKLHPTASSLPSKTFDALRNTALDKNPAGQDDRYGFGIINARQAINWLQSAPPPTTTPPPTTPPPGSPSIVATPDWPESVMLPPDGSARFNLRIQNVGTADLTFRLSEMAEPGSPVDFPWLDETPVAGTVPPSGSTDVMVQFSTFSTRPGDYDGNIHIDSNDPAHSPMMLHVHVHIAAPEPRIRVEPNYIKVDPLDRGTMGAAEVTIYNEGEGDLAWEISDRFAKGGPGGPGPGAKSLPSPQGGESRVLPNNKTAGAAAGAPPGPPPPPPGSSGIKFEGEWLVVGMSDMGELDWKNPPDAGSRSGAGYGFEYKPARPHSDGVPGMAESIAVTWNGEGYVVFYDGRTVSSYPDNGHPGLNHTGRETLRDTPDEAKQRMSAMTVDNRLSINHVLHFDKHSRSVVLRTEFKNTSPDPIGDLRYKRVIDWDANASGGDDVWSFNPDSFALTAIDPPSPAGGKYFSYGMAATGDSWPAVYDWDLNAWDDYTTIDHGGNWMQNGPDSPVAGDLAGAIYFALGSLAPGGSKSVALIYTVGEGDTAEEAYENMLSNLGRGTGGDVPWLSEDVTSGSIAPGGSQVVNLTIDGRGMDMGRYFAELLIKSNDPGRGMMRVPVEVNVIPPIRWIITDPEDVNVGGAGASKANGGAPKVDIDKVGVQVTRDSAMFLTKFYGQLPLFGPDPMPLVSILMLDTDEDTATGYTGPLSNDVGADYMAFGFVFPPGPGGPAAKAAARAAVARADMANYAKKLPGLDVSKVKSSMVKALDGGGPSGQLFIFQWNGTTKKWSPLIETFTIGMNSDDTIWQILWLVTMVDDGSMKVTAAAGDIFDIKDVAPDRGHGGTIPATNIGITGITAEAIAESGDEPPTFLTGQQVVLTATAANNGDEPIRDVQVNFQVYPILEVKNLEPGEPGFPGKKYVFGDPIAIDSGLIDKLNPGDTQDTSVLWIPELVPDPKAGQEGHDVVIHDYLVKASTPVLPREADAGDNEATLQVDLQVGVEVGLSNIYVSDTEPGATGKKAVVEEVFTGLQYWIAVTVKNNGALPLPGDYSVTFFAGDDELGAVDVGALGPGESNDVTLPWVPETSGANMSIQAIGADLPGQMNYDDDMVSTEVDVSGGIDVSVTKPVVSPSATGNKYNYGTELTFTTTVTNEGMVDLSDVLVKFSIGGTLIGSETIPSLASGDHTDVSIEWTADVLGTLNVLAGVDPLTGEEDTSDNSKSTGITIQGADIAVTNITITDTKGKPIVAPKKGLPVKVNAVVENLGTTTQTFKVEMWVETPVKGTVQLKPIQNVSNLKPPAPNKPSTKVVTWNWIVPSDPGEGSLRAVITGVPGDINPDNNEMTISTTITNSVKDVAVTGVSVLGVPMAGRVSTVRVDVANQGNEPASFTLEVLAADKLVRAIPVALLPGTTRTLSVPWKPGAMGSYALTARVKAGDVPDDVDSEDRSVQIATTAYVPMTMKITSTEATPGAANKGARVDIQLMDITGRKPLAIAGLNVKLALPAGVASTSAALVTDEKGHAVVYISRIGNTKTAMINLIIDGLARGTVRVNF
ncbi:MAG: S8 family serine peptidase [Chloroflexi bacterium]|nr:S8 family serine peptidase [Chloroflexota bacterium]